VALQWNTKVRYMTSMPMSYGIGATLVRKEVWEQMSEADRKIANKIIRKQNRKLLKSVRRDNDTARKQITRKGVKIIETPPELIREFDDAAKQVWKELVGKVFSQEELDMVLKYRDEFRSKTP
jgi:TRAP-type C4-dicarboxylate transport system substrate-binding protein